MTRYIGGIVLEALKVKYVDVKIIQRDLAQNPPPHLTPDILEIFYQRNIPKMAFADELATEVLVSDIILVEAPMYNFSVPSVLKSWIDYVLRAGRTFTYNKEGAEGLVKGKKVILILSSGGIYTSGDLKNMTHQEPYLRTVFEFIGLTDIDTIHIEGVGGGGEKAVIALEKAKQKLNVILKNMS